MVLTEEGGKNSSIARQLQVVVEEPPRHPRHIGRDSGSY